MAAAPLHTVYTLADKLGDTRSFEPNWFSHLLYVPIRNPALLVREAEFGNRLEALGREMAQDATPVFAYKQELDSRLASNAYDSKPWRPTLSGAHATAGIVRVDKEGPPQYAIVVHTNGGEPATHFADYVHNLTQSTPQTGVLSLLSTPQYRMAQSYSARNAQRIAALIAGAVMQDIGAPVHDVISVREDELAARSPHGYAMRPLLAVPEVHTRYNDFGAAQLPDGRMLHDQRNRVYVRNAAICTDCSGTVLRHRDHLKGFALEQQASGGAVDAHPVFDVVHHESQNDNADYYAQKNSGRDKWRDYAQQVYKTSAGSAASSAALPLWSVSERVAPDRARATLLKPVAMFIDAKPATSKK